MTKFLNKLPDCIIDKIYSKIIYPQPKYLLEDIKSYVLFMNFVNSGHMNINRILWILILYNSFYNDNKSKDYKFRNIVLNNDYEQDYIYNYIKKYAKNISINDRYRIMKFILYPE
jgi:hypothetical protein